MHHLAIADLCKGRFERGTSYVLEAHKLAETVNVPIARLRHKLNGILILRAADREPGLVAELTSQLSEIEHHGELAIDGKADIDALSSDALQDPDVIARTYKPGFLEYWSQNPLEMLPKGLLPFDAEGEDM